MVAAERRRVRFVVTGRVQGVAFRACTQREATRLGAAGFVRNRTDGAVEGEAEGAADVIDALLQWLAGGPAWARVDRLDVDELGATASDTAFEIRR